MDRQTDPESVPPAPADTFGDAGLHTAFRGPFAQGVPADALTVRSPRLGRFGVAEVTRMALITVVMAACVLRALALRVVRRRRGPWSTVAAEGLVDAFERLGPTFVKLGQLVASSPGLFPTPLADACLRCLDEVPPFDGDTARALIEADLGHPVSAIFRSFDDRPLSAASIAQVHACTLPDGRDAVVKLQRPNIARRMNTDLRIMYLFARPLMRTAAGRRLNATGIVQDLHRVTNEELNFALEAQRQDRFRTSIHAFGDNAHITAPEVFWDYCGPRMICMERMAGRPLDEFDELADRGVDGEMMLRRGIKVWMESAMVHGPFHGDVHAGNLWLLDDGRASYLDFGIMGELDEQWRRILRDMQYTAMIDGKWSRVVRNWKEVGVMSPDAGDDEQLGAVIKSMMDPLLERSLGEVSMGELMRENIELGRSLGIRTPRELVLITKQLLYFERYAKALAPTYNMAKDLYLVRNIFPEDVARVAAERGLTLPA
jgi:predicted unusual protein kinase regulating ubiquinone biosynthesis (AarF/ABC1/UbiB family)